LLTTRFRRLDPDLLGRDIDIDQFIGLEFHAT